MDGRRGERGRAGAVRANKQEAKYVMLHFVGRWTDGRTRFVHVLVRHRWAWAQSIDDRTIDPSIALLTTSKMHISLMSGSKFKLGSLRRAYVVFAHPEQRGGASSGQAKDGVAHLGLLAACILTCLGSSSEMDSRAL